jgi:hypothetical protein
MKKIITLIGCSLLLLACNKEVDSTSGGTGTGTGTGSGSGSGTTTQGPYANIVFKGKTYNFDYKKFAKVDLSTQCESTNANKYQYVFGDNDNGLYYSVPLDAGKYNLHDYSCSGGSVDFFIGDDDYQSEGGTIESDGKGKCIINANLILIETNEKATLTGTVYVPF